ncbi:hypothetical protein [Sorangium sp. So ce394]|uniref:WD40/YVTN/BNR-like repeat-containing protein n=1 Tax=Sorangium sp. So ce394 TaxID=3133310 RepID=UPI003F5B5A59
MSIWHSAVWGRRHLLIVVGSAGHVLRSEDGGQRWRRMQTPVRQDLRALAGAGPALIAAGQSGTLLSSSDEGRRWIDVSCRAKADLRGVALRDDGEAIAVGLGGTVLCSRDRGQTWEAGPGLEDLCLEAAAIDAEGRFLALALEGELATLQGATWVRHEIPGRHPRALCARGGIVVVGDGDGRIHTSRTQAPPGSRTPPGAGAPSRRCGSAPPARPSRPAMAASSRSARTRAAPGRAPPSGPISSATRCGATTERSRDVGRGRERLAAQAS